MRPLPPGALRSFVAVAQSGSFTAASERVSLSQSTVSQHIRRLEELLDRPLFERDTRNVHLSQHGDALFALRGAHSRTDGRGRHVGVRAAAAGQGAARDVGGFRVGAPDGRARELRAAQSGSRFRDLDRAVGRPVRRARRGAARSRVREAHRRQPARPRDPQRAAVLVHGPDSRITGHEAVLPLRCIRSRASRRRVLESLEAVGRPYRIAVVSSVAVCRRASAPASARSPAT